MSALRQDGIHHHSTREDLLDGLKLVKPRLLVACTINRWGHNADREQLIFLSLTLLLVKRLLSPRIWQIAKNRTLLSTAQELMTQTNNTSYN